MGVQRVVLDGQRTWTVTGEDHLPAGPVEEYLEFLRVAQQSSPNTVRSYATGLARWWAYLSTAGLALGEGRPPPFIPFAASPRAPQPPPGAPPPLPAPGVRSARPTGARRGPVRSLFL